MPTAAVPRIASRSWRRAQGLIVDGLPILTINSLSMADSSTTNDAGSLVITYGLPSGATTVAQQITVNDHFAGANAQTGVELINFNGAVYQGYALGAADYLISREEGNANLSASTANNVIVGESSADDITGGLGNDLIFGAAGDNDLVGGDGDDLLVGGTGAGDDDELDSRTQRRWRRFRGGARSRHDDRWRRRRHLRHRRSA